MNVICVVSSPANYNRERAREEDFKLTAGDSRSSLRTMSAWSCDLG